jgi:hypothetical protein
LTFLAFSFLLGAGLVSLFLLPFVLAQYQLSTNFVRCIAGVFSAICLAYLVTNRKDIHVPINPAVPGSAQWLQRIAYVCVAVAPILVHFLTSSIFAPDFGWDVLSIHANRSQKLFSSGFLREFQGPVFSPYNMYPYLYPLLQTYCYEIAGAALIPGVYPITILFAACTGLFIFEICRLFQMSLPVCLIAVSCYYFSCEQLMSSITAAYLDPIVACYFCSIMFLTLNLTLGLKPRPKISLLVGLILASLAHVKVEGCVLSVILGCAYALALGSQLYCDGTSARGYVRHSLFLVIPFALLTALWYIPAAMLFPAKPYYRGSFLQNLHNLTDTLALMRDLCFSNKYVRDMWILSPSEQWVPPWSTGMFLLSGAVAIGGACRRAGVARFLLLIGPSVLFFVALVVTYLKSSQDQQAITSFNRVLSDVFPIWAVVIGLSLSYSEERLSSPRLAKIVSCTLVCVSVLPTIVFSKWVLFPGVKGEFVDSIGPVGQTSSPVTFDCGLTFLGYRVEQDNPPFDPFRDGRDVLYLDKPFNLSVYWRADESLDLAWYKPDRMFSFSFTFPDGSETSWTYRSWWTIPSTWRVGCLWKQSMVVPPRKIWNQCNGFAVGVRGAKVAQARSVDKAGGGICGTVAFVTTTWNDTGYLGVGEVIDLLEKKEEMRGRTKVLLENKTIRNRIFPYGHAIYQKVKDYAPLTLPDEVGSVQEFRSWLVKQMPPGPYDHVLMILDSDKSHLAENVDELAKGSEFSIEERFPRIRVVRIGGL